MGNYSILYRLLSKGNRVVYLQQGGITPFGMSPAFMPYIPTKPIIVAPLTPNDFPYVAPPSKPSVEIKVGKGTPFFKSKFHDDAQLLVNHINDVYTLLQNGKVDPETASVEIKYALDALEKLNATRNTSLAEQENAKYEDLIKSGQRGVILSGDGNILGSTGAFNSFLGSRYDQLNDFEIAILNPNESGTTNFYRGVVYNKNTSDLIKILQGVFSNLGRSGNGKAYAYPSQHNFGSIDVQDSVFYGVTSGSWHEFNNEFQVNSALSFVQNVLGDMDVLSFVYREGEKRANDFFEQYSSSVGFLADNHVYLAGNRLAALQDEEKKVASYSPQSEKEEEEKSQRLEKIKKEREEIKKSVEDFNKKVDEAYEKLKSYYESKGVTPSEEIKKYIRAAINSGFKLTDNNLEEFNNLVKAYFIYDLEESRNLKDVSVADRAGLYYNFENENTAYAAQLRRELAKRYNIDEKYLVEAAKNLKGAINLLILNSGLDTKKIAYEYFAQSRKESDRTEYKNMHLFNPGGGGKSKENLVRDLEWLIMWGTEMLNEKLPEIGASSQSKIVGKHDLDSNREVSVYQADVNVKTLVSPPSIISGTDSQEPNSWFLNEENNAPPSLMLKINDNGRTVFVPLVISDNIDLTSISDSEGKDLNTGAFAVLKTYFYDKSKREKVLQEDREKQGKLIDNYKNKKVKELDQSGNYKVKAAFYMAIPEDVKKPEFDSNNNIVKLNIGEKEYVAKVPSIMDEHYINIMKKVKENKTTKVVGVYVRSSINDPKYNKSNETSLTANAGNVGVDNPVQQQKQSGGQIPVNSHLKGGSIASNDEAYIKYLLDGIFD